MTTRKLYKTTIAMHHFCPLPLPVFFQKIKKIGLNDLNHGGVDLKYYFLEVLDPKIMHLL